MKQHNKDVKREAGSVKSEATVFLASLALTQGIIDQTMAEYNATVERITAPYEQTIEKLRADLAADAKELIALMKKNKAVLFDGTDVVNLSHGSLIHSVGDKVTIPKTALAECKAQGFNDVIKIVESLDRDKIEKWPDAKLVLIGAQRKTKEEFSYDLMTPAKSKRSEARSAGGIIPEA
jgi:hypothetical protein